MLAISGRKGPESGVVVSLSFYMILAGSQYWILEDALVREDRTAPYLETCLTSRAPSLKSGRGTMAGEGFGCLGSRVVSCSSTEFVS